MYSPIKHDIIALAKATPEVEICGFIYYGSDNQLKLFSCKNHSPSPADDFYISEDDYLKCDSKGVIVGVYHSHPGDIEAFSEADIDYIQEIGVPLYLYTVGTGAWKEYIPPTYEVNLTELPYIMGLYDCYSIIRNGLRQKCAVYLSDYDRDDKFGMDDDTASIILKNVIKEGCSIIGKGPESIGVLKQNDIILFNTASINPLYPIHFGLFLGKSRFLHHPQGVLSREDQLSDRWISRVAYIIRHKSA
jgi:proteasome lid subunit RPN8/RPN11